MPDVSKHFRALSAIYEQLAIEFDNGTMPLPTPRPGLTKVWEFRAGDIAPGPMAPGRPTDNSHRILCGNYEASVPVNYLPPIVGSGGVVMSKIDDSSADGHCMFRPISPAMPEGYFPIGTVGKIKFDVMATNLERWWKRVPWAICFQGWSNNQNNPPLSIGVINAQWRVTIQVDGRNVLHEDNTRFESGEWVIDMKTDPADGYVVAELNGKVVTDYHGPTISPANRSGLNLTFGCYASRSQGSESPGASFAHNSASVELAI